jgi:hypothetical protein|tara:strand:- start:260 stop:538 length:279 start_codon:yes stop_codon:yes gene_type:complete
MFVSAHPMTKEIKMIDKINPDHYKKAPLESIEYIEHQLGPNFKYYLVGTIYKYLHRWEYKDEPLTDLKKARWYLDKLIQQIEEQEPWREEPL